METKTVYYYEKDGVLYVDINCPVSMGDLEFKNVKNIEDTKPAIVKFFKENFRNVSENLEIEFRKLK